MKMRSYNFCHTNTKNPGNNLGIFCLITGRPKLNGYHLSLSDSETFVERFHYTKNNGLNNEALIAQAIE